MRELNITELDQVNGAGFTDVIESVGKAIGEAIAGAIEGIGEAISDVVDSVSNAIDDYRNDKHIDKVMQCIEAGPCTSADITDGNFRIVVTAPKK